MFYLTEPIRAARWGSAAWTGHHRSAGSFLTAIDPKTGKVAWREQYPMAGEGGGGGGLLTTAGGLVFGGDAGGNIVAFDATTGKPIWHSHIGNITNPPITYMLDGRQHLLVAANNMLYDFMLYDPPAPGAVVSLPAEAGSHAVYWPVLMQGVQ